MKKLYAALALILAVTLCACSGGKNYSKEDRTKTADLIGVRYVLPQEWAVNTLSPTTAEPESSILAVLNFNYGTDAMMEEISDAAFQGSINDSLIPIAKIIAFKPENRDSEEVSAVLANYSQADELGENCGYSYILASGYTGDLSAIENDADAIADYQKRLDTVDKLAKSVEFFDFDPNAIAESLEKRERVISFRTQTLEGEDITSEYFADYGITFVNFWGTYCYPDIDETASLAELNQKIGELNGKVGFLQVVIDTPDADAEALAIKIKQDAGADYTSIKPDAMLAGWIGQNLEGVPTSILVDNDGFMIGEQIKGIQDLDYYIQEIQKALDEQ